MATPSLHAPSVASSLMQPCESSRPVPASRDRAATASDPGEATYTWRPSGATATALAPSSARPS
jgi:hypothetical protein